MLPRLRFAGFGIAASTALSWLAVSTAVCAQVVDDESDAAIGRQDTHTVLALIKGHIDKASDAKVTTLRRSKGSIVCGSVNVKGKDGRYLGERGFVADVAELTFGRLPEGVELLDPHAADFQDKEQIRQLYFDHCLIDRGRSEHPWRRLTGLGRDEVQPPPDVDKGALQLVLGFDRLGRTFSPSRR